MSMHPSVLHMSATTVFWGLQRTDWLLHVPNGIPQPGISRQNESLILENCSVIEVELRWTWPASWWPLKGRIRGVMSHWLHFRALINHIIHMCRWWGCTRWAEKAECVHHHTECTVCVWQLSHVHCSNFTHNNYMKPSPLCCALGEGTVMVTLRKYWLKIWVSWHFYNWKVFME